MLSLKKLSGVGILLIILLASFYRFYYDVNNLIDQLTSTPSVISFRSGFYGLLGAGLGLLVIILGMILETIYKGKTSPKVLNFLNKILYIALASIFILPIMAKIIIPLHLESIQYRYCDVPYRGALYSPTVYTNNPKSCLVLLKKECAKPGRIFKPCVTNRMSAYMKLIREDL